MGRSCLSPRATPNLQALEGWCQLQRVRVRELDHPANPVLDLMGSLYSVTAVSPTDVWAAGGASSAASCAGPARAPSRPTRSPIFLTNLASPSACWLSSQQWGVRIGVRVCFRHLQFVAACCSRDAG